MPIKKVFNVKRKDDLIVQDLKDDVIVEDLNKKNREQEHNVSTVKRISIKDKIVENKEQESDEIVQTANFQEIQENLIQKNVVEENVVVKNKINTNLIKKNLIHENCLPEYKKKVKCVCRCNKNVCNIY
jgi:hypothetical protein